MKNNFAQEYARKEAIIAAYNAAKETGNEAGIEKAKADMRSLNEEIGAKGDAYAFVYRLYREMKECGNEHIDLHDAIHDELKVLGDIYIERDGEITPMADMDWQSIHELANDGLCEVEGGQETGQNADKARTDADKARTDGLTISFPKGDFTEAALANLEKILAAKAGLIKKALGADRLTVDASDEKWVAFPWWDTLPTVEDATVYCAFIAAVCKLAQNAKRVTAKETPVESEKYAFRCFLLRLGFIGAEHKTARKILLSKRSGSAAFATEQKGGKAK